VFQRGSSVALAREHIKKKAGPGPRTEDSDEASVRKRILSAAFSAFVEHGYSGASTLEIATRAKVSKRELYALVGSKQDMLVTCIAERSARMRLAPSERPAVRDRDSLTRVLQALGARLLGEVSHTTVVATFRLAIAEAKRAPEVAQVLDTQARQPHRAALEAILDEACAAGVLRGDRGEMAERFVALLWGDLLMGLLLRTAELPGQSELKRRAANAVSGLLRLHAP
jgi:AcrR family transcriptional regulator